jgi:hypothetical protein
MELRSGSKTPEEKKRGKQEKSRNGPMAHGSTASDCTGAYKEGPKTAPIMRLFSSPSNKADNKDIRNKSIVKLIVYINSINDIDTQNQKLFADIWVGLYDCENKATQAFQLSFEDGNFEENFPHFGGSGDVKAKLPRWDLQVRNGHNLTYVYQETNRPTLRYYKNEDAYYRRQRIQGYFQQTFDLTYFPFDVQNLKIQMSLDISNKYASFLDNNYNIPDPAVKVEFHEISEQIMNGTEWKIVEKGWEIVDVSGYSEAVINIKVKRKPGFYCIGILLPLFLIHVAAWFVCFTGDFTTQPSENLSYLGTLLLAVLTVRWTIIEKLPKMNYVCLIDKIFLVATFHIFSLMFLVTFRNFRIEKFNDVCIVAVILLFVGFVLFYFF